ncbi:hypothetical protein BJV77DRAFT_1185491 [Russula vinacea]|nr:hypothetical protein BJV77DRAFT_1185491 [Russula vinacea]
MTLCCSYRSPYTGVVHGQDGADKMVVHCGVIFCLKIARVWAFFLIIRFLTRDCEPNQIYLSVLADGLICSLQRQVMTNQY